MTDKSKESAWHRKLKFEADSIGVVLKWDERSELLVKSDLTWGRGGKELVSHLISSEDLNDEATDVLISTLLEITDLKNDLLRSPVEDSKMKDGLQWGPAALAAWLDKKRVCKTIVTLRGSAKDMSPWGDGLPAIILNDPELMSLVISLGADPGARNEEGENALTQICSLRTWKDGMKPLFMEMAERIGLANVTSRGECLLETAIVSQNEEACSTLLSLGMAEGLGEWGVGKLLKKVEELEKERAGREKFSAWITSRLVSIMEGESLTKSLKEDDQVLARFGKIVKGLIEDGRLSLDGMALGSLDDLLKTQRNDSGKKRRI